jgi:hypothetical protein
LVPPTSAPVVTTDNLITLVIDHFTGCTKPAHTVPLTLVANLLQALAGNIARYSVPASDILNKAAEKIIELD